MKERPRAAACNPAASSGGLEGVIPCASELERLVTLTTIDELWSEYLAGLGELRSGVQWVSLAGGGRDPVQNYFKFGGFEPFREYIKGVDKLFEELQGCDRLRDCPKRWKTRTPPVSIQHAAARPGPISPVISRSELR